MNLTVTESLTILSGAIITAPILMYLAPLLSGLAEVVLDYLVHTVVRDETMDYEAFVPLEGFLQNKCKSWGINNTTYYTKKHFIKSRDGIRSVFYRNGYLSNRIYWYKGRPLVIAVAGGGGDGTPRVLYLRGTVNWSKLLQEAADYHAEFEAAIPERTKFFIKRFGGDDRARNNRNDAPEGGPAADANKLGHEPINFNQDDIGTPTVINPMENLSLGFEAKEIIKDVKFWIRHKEWHLERGVPWKRGYILYGDPGTGKTSLVRAIAEDLDIPICIFDLQTMSNSEFLNSFNSIQGYPMKIVLFEDFDTVFHGRDNVVENSNLAFTTILNVLDGIERLDGVLLFVTTNHIEHIDEALGAPSNSGESSRPGRIDLVVKLPGLPYEGRLKMARRIIKDEDLSVKMALKHEDVPAAKFQEACIAEAKVLLWGVENKAKD